MDRNGVFALSKKNKNKNKVGTDLKALDIIFQHKHDTLRTQYCTFQILQV